MVENVKQSSPAFNAALMAALFGEKPPVFSDAKCIDISDLAREHGVTKRTLRFYGEKGLLVAARRKKNGKRLYSERDRATLLLILVGKRAGMTLREILELVGASALKPGVPAQPAIAARLLRAARAELVAQREELGIGIAEIDEAVVTVLDPARVQAEPAAAIAA